MKHFTTAIFLSLGLGSAIAYACDHWLHATIDNCDFANDTNCARTVSHQLLDIALSGSSGPTGPRDGVYKPTDSSSNLCDQEVHPVLSGGTITALRVTYLSPCSASDNFTCGGNICFDDATDDDDAIEFVSADRYIFINQDNVRTEMVWSRSLQHESFAKADESAL